MDQDSFRLLLQDSPSHAASRTAVGTNSGPKAKVASEPSFKPRKVDKSSAQPKYRDRAAERRLGQGNDYAQVEALLQEFEDRAAQAEDKAAVEKQRQYLGGDSEHTILVKGLDIALLEQNKARGTVSDDDDDELEQVYQEMTAGSSAAPSVPVKRTKEDLIRELKLKRQRDNAEPENHTKESEARVLEEAKKAGKFKPIGSRQVGEPSKSKKVKVKDGERKKKKTKVIAAKDDQKQRASGEAGVAVADKEEHTSQNDANTSLSQGHQGPRSAEPVDIFAGVEEYNLIESDDNDNENVDDGNVPIPEDVAARDSRSRWCEVEESGVLPLQRSLPRTVQSSQSIEVPEEPEHEQQARLVPLASSSLPSIQDFLAADDALQAEEKKKQRKEKKKGGEAGGTQKQRSAELKADRDYKRLKSSIERKAGS